MKKCMRSQLRFLLAIIWMLTAVHVGAQDFTTMGISTVVSIADQMLKDGNYMGALTPLEEAIKRTSTITDKQTRSVCQTCRFQLGLANYNLGRTKEAVEALEEFIANDPRPDEITALKIMAHSYYQEEQWEKMGNAASKILDLPNVFFKEDLATANLWLGQSLYRREKWEDAIAPLATAAKTISNDRERERIHIMIVRSLVNAKRWKELYTWLPRVYRTNAKYDINMNITIMDAARDRFEADDYLNALHLYRMVLPRDELFFFQKAIVNGLTKELELTLREDDKETILIEIEQLNASIDILKDLPPYEDEVIFRIGQIYAETKRYWEAFVIFDKLCMRGEQEQVREIWQMAMLQSVLVLYDVKEVERAEERIFEYLDQYPNGKLSRTFLSLMVRDNLQRKIYEKVISCRPYIDRLNRPEEDNDIIQEGDLHYMLAFAYFQTREYVDAGEEFKRITEEYKIYPNVSDALYFYGMSFVMRGDYQNAYDQFQAYQQQYPDGQYASASMFRQAVCLFGLEKIGDSEVMFTQFIEKHPKSEFVSEAYSMRGDIEASKTGDDDPETPENEYDPDTFKRALADYRKGLNTAVNPQQAAYAVFQAAKIFEAEFQWEEIIHLMNFYLDLQGEKADVAQAVYWIGQSQIQLNQFSQAISAYADAIKRFGNEVEQEGVDRIITKLVELATDELQEEDLEVLKGTFERKLLSMDEKDKVLALRLRVTLALMQGEEAAVVLGEELVQKLPKLSTTTPVSLALMCDAAGRTDDQELIDKLYKYFTNTFVGDELLWHAYRMKTFELEGRAQYEEMLEVIEEAQSQFGAAAHMDWAQIARAETLFKLERFEEAIAEYNTVLTINMWRGVTFAKAMFGLGSSYRESGNLELAFSFFQRTYLMYRSYAEGVWAAKGYVACIETLLKLDRIDEAVEVWKNMLDDEYVNSRTEVNLINDMMEEYKPKLDQLKNQVAEQSGDKN